MNKTTHKKVDSKVLFGEERIVKIVHNGVEYVLQHWVWVWIKSIKVKNSVKMPLFGWKLNL